MTYDDGNGCTANAKFRISSDCSSPGPSPGGCDDIEISQDVKTQLTETGGEITFSHGEPPEPTPTDCSSPWSMSEGAEIVLKRAYGCTEEYQGERHGIVYDDDEENYDVLITILNNTDKYIAYSGRFYINNENDAGEGGKATLLYRNFSSGKSMHYGKIEAEPSNFFIPPKQDNIPRMVVLKCELINKGFLDEFKSIQILFESLQESEGDTYLHRSWQSELSRYATIEGLGTYFKKGMSITIIINEDINNSFTQEQYDNNYKVGSDYIAPTSLFYFK